MAECIHPACGSDLSDGSRWTGDTSLVTCTSCKIALAVAAERERIRLAVLGCVTCGRIHERREVEPCAHGDGGITWADPGDGHPYQARYRSVSVAELIGGAQ
jgi:hypothetical protein